MIRFLFRCLSTMSLAVAVVMAVLDATRTVAAEALVMTPLGTSWAAISPDTMERTQAFVSGQISPEAWNPAALSVLALPGFIVFAALSLIFYLIGRKPAEDPGRFAFKS